MPARMAARKKMVVNQSLNVRRNLAFSHSNDYDRICQLAWIVVVIMILTNCVFLGIVECVDNGRREQEPRK